MMRIALLSVLVLSACVQTPPAADTTAGTGMMAGQRRDWPRMISTVDATGRSKVVQSGTAPTVIVSGASDLATAVKVLGQFCGRKIDPAGFDTQFVYRDPASGDYWFDGFCG